MRPLQIFSTVLVKYRIHIPPITELKSEGAAAMGGGDGLGAALHGSRPSSYTEALSGFSLTKLPPNPPFAEVD